MDKSAVITSTAMNMTEKPSKANNCVYFGVIWRSLLVSLALIYVIISSREMYLTRLEMGKLRSLQIQNECSGHSKNEKNMTKESKDELIRKRRNTELAPLNLQGAQLGELANNLNTDRNSGNVNGRDPVNGNCVTPGNNGNCNGNSNNRGGQGNGNNNDGGKGGSTYVRWGKKSCRDTPLLYSGYAGGTNPVEGYGGSAELECLPTNPVFFRNTNSAPLAKTTIIAAKFSLGAHTRVFTSRSNPDNGVIPCSVCFTRKEPVLMIPGQTGCPTGWSSEYNGYLMSTPGVASHLYFTKNYCVDINPEKYAGHEASAGTTLTFVQAGKCLRGQSPCSSYRRGTRISCVVCTKLTERESRTG